MSSFISKLFSKPERVDDEKLKAQARLSFENSQFDRLLFLKIFSKKLNTANYESFVCSCLQVTAEHKVSVKEELEKLKAYIQLMDTYSDESFFYKLDIKEADSLRESMSIAPFILLPLIKNAFYRGYNSLEKFPVRIRINLSESSLKLEVSNRVNHNLVDQEDNEDICYFKARLQDLYLDKHTLIFNSNTNLFKATLIVNLS